MGEHRGDHGRRRELRGFVVSLFVLSCGAVLMLFDAYQHVQQTTWGSHVSHRTQQVRSTFTGPRVFVGVLSTSNGLEHRQAIRATWGADRRLARVMFFVLRPQSEHLFSALREEAATYGDLVVASDALESYYNASYSTINMFKAAAGLGNQITHFLKTDEDCYVRVPLLLDAIQAMPTQWLYAGRVRTIKVNRNESYR